MTEVDTPTDEAMLGERVRVLVRERPLMLALAAGAVGVALGGIFFGRTARLVFLGALGYLANDLWRNDGRSDLFGSLSAR